MIWAINLSPNSNYLSCSSSSGHLLSFDISTLGPSQGIGALISEAPLSGHGRGRPNKCIGSRVLRLLLWHWFCLLFNSLKALPKTCDGVLILSLSIICYFPISEEKKVQLRNIEEWVAIKVCSWFNHSFGMGCLQDSRAEADRLR